MIYSRKLIRWTKLVKMLARVLHRRQAWGQQAQVTGEPTGCFRTCSHALGSGGIHPARRLKGGSFRLGAKRILFLDLKIGLNDRKYTTGYITWMVGESEVMRMRV